MVAILIPHFDLPFRFAQGHAVEADQDTLEDVTNCVQACLLTVQGQRLEIQDFGIPDLTFETQPLALEVVINDVIAQEPRAHLLMNQAPDRFDQLIARVTALVSTKEVS